MRDDPCCRSNRNARKKKKNVLKNTMYNVYTNFI